MKHYLLGDIHGNLVPVSLALAVRKQAPLIQLGDFGFADTYRKLHRYPSDDLKIIHGNHDDYLSLKKYPHCLGRYGMLNESTFFVAGARSIDIEYRVPGLSWWPEEELSYKEANDCLDLYHIHSKSIKTILSHECPPIACHLMHGRMPFNSQTSLLLGEIMKIKPPTNWYYGHHHIPFQQQYGDTLFRCVNINEVVEVDL